MKISNLGPNIWYFEEAIPEVNLFLDLLEKNNDNERITHIIPKWSRWSDGGPKEDKYVEWVEIGPPMGEEKFVDWERTLNRSGTVWPKIEPDTDAHKEAYEILKMIDVPLNNVIDYYWSQNPSLKPLKYISKNYPIRKYRTGGSMGKHKDQNPFDPNPTMDISILIYLNDNYEGGELYFNDLDLKIKPSAGSILIFACEHMHESLEIKTGNKIYIPMFVHSRYGLITGFREVYAGLLDLIDSDS